HVVRSPRIPPHELTVELARRAIRRDDPATWHADHARPHRRRDGAVGRSVAVAAPPLAAFMPIRVQRRRELLAQRHVHRFANVSTQLRLDLLTKLQDADRPCGTLLHGVPPSPLLTASCLGSTGGYAIFLFPQDSGHIHELRWLKIASPRTRACRLR